VKETEMRQKITKRILQEHPQTLIVPIESHGTRIGVPDLFIKSPFSEGWMELKQFTLNKQGTISIPFRPGQLAWIHNYLSLHGNMTLLGTFKLNSPTKRWLKLWFIIKGNYIYRHYSYDEFIAVADMGLLQDIDIVKLLKRK